MDRHCIKNNRKRSGESDSAGNKRARLDRRNRIDRDRRRNETEEEKKLRQAERTERDRVRRAASSENKMLLNLKHQRIELPDWIELKLRNSNI